VEEEALDAKIDEVVQALLAGGPKAQAAAKALIDAVADRPLTAEVLEDTAQRIARLRATDEAREGLSAFLEKRPAAWVPRP
jgi:methylglutaconyl-CoA hydratase